MSKFAPGVLCIVKPHLKNGGLIVELIQKIPVPNHWELMPQGPFHMDLDLQRKSYDEWVQYRRERGLGMPILVLPERDMTPITPPGMIEDTLVDTPTEVTA